MHPTFWRELTVLAHCIRQVRHGRSSSAAQASISQRGHGARNLWRRHHHGRPKPRGPRRHFDPLTDMQATFTRLENLRIPVIMAIHGGCTGGAVDMVTAGCIRYATQDAFCIQEINIGMVADVGTLQRLPKLIPLGVVKEFEFYTGRRLSAAKALG